MNSEKYPDPTAEKAIRDTNRLPYNVRKALNALNSVASLQGFLITEIQDKRTGKKFKIKGE